MRAGRSSHGEGKSAFFALGLRSRPGARAQGAFVCGAGLSRRARPRVRRSSSNRTGRRRAKSSKKSRAIAASRLKTSPFIFAPTQSLAGGVQVVARVLEVALHKTHELKFPLSRIVDGMASAPLSPPHPDFVQAMGRTNDAIIYGGQAHLFVTGPAADAKALAEQLPSTHVARLRTSLRRSVQGLQGRFLRDRSDAVQPGARHRDGGRNGRDVLTRGKVDQALLDASFG